MNSTDRALGMHRAITRRDFVNGVAVAAGASLLPEWGWALEREQQFVPEQAADYYPPRLTGMRGSHAGSFEVAHQMRDGRRPDLASALHTRETYDLVVVGGGLSGLAAAYYFVQRVGRDARVLVIDNHDDFGGHAKRNEFMVDGRMLALNGGTLNIESPIRYNLPSRQLLEGIGVNLDRFVKSNETNRSLYASFGLRGAHFFDEEPGAKIGSWCDRSRRREADEAASALSTSHRCQSRRRRVRTCFAFRIPTSPTTCLGSLRLRRRSGSRR